MFTVIPNTRPANLFLITALAILTVVLLTLSVYPAVSAPKQVAIPMTGKLETESDYYQRHPELRIWAATVPDMVADFALRHPEWTVSVQNAAVPVTGITEASDFFQRHPGLNVSVESAADLTDYFVRHPELRTPNTTIDLSDYFLRH